MKISFDIECTPEEARRLFGFADTKLLQENFLLEMQKKLFEQMQPHMDEKNGETISQNAQEFMDQIQHYWSNMLVGNMDAGKQDKPTPKVKK